MRLCQTAPPCESHSVNKFAHNDLKKVLPLCLVHGQSQDTQLSGSLKKWVIELYFLCKGGFSPKKRPNLHVYAEIYLGLSTLSPKKVSFQYCLICL